MARSTSSQSARNVRNLQGARTVALACLIAALVGITPAQAVTKAQLDSNAAQVQNINKSIAATENRLSGLERDLRATEGQILNQRKQLREERSAGRKQVFDARRDLKRQVFEIERIERDVSLIDADINVVKRDIERDKARFAELNVVKQSLEESAFRQRQADYQHQLDLLAEKKQPLEAQLQKARTDKTVMETQLGSMDAGDDSTLDRDPRMARLTQKRDRLQTEVTALRNQMTTERTRLRNQQDNYQKLSAQYRREQSTRQQERIAAATLTNQPAPAAIPATPSVLASPALPVPALDRNDYASYVFVISGDQEQDIEQTLHLKNWVESYGAKYIQASWKGFGSGTTAVSFQEAFRSYLRQIPPQAKLVLIGHGLGGGAAIEAATQAAFAENRTIDFLAALDPIGTDNLRANIVYDTRGSCSRPDPGDEMANSDYVECIKSARKRVITGNIKHFYNRWQKDAGGPLDFQRQLASLNTDGKVESVPTATGRFETASSIETDQKRLYFAGDRNAHRMLLAEEAKQLPKLLVQHLR